MTTRRVRPPVPRRKNLEPKPKPLSAEDIVREAAEELTRRLVDYDLEAAVIVGAQVGLELKLNSQGSMDKVTNIVTFANQQIEIKALEARLAQLKGQ